MAAPFDAMYAFRPGRGLSAEIDATFIMEPCCCFFINGTTALHVRKIAVALMDIIRSQSDKVTCSISVAAWAIPATFTNTSTC